MAGAAQVVDAQLHHVAGAQVLRGLLAHAHASGRAGREHVAGQQGHELAHVGNQEGQPENEVGGVALLPGLTVHREPEAQAGRVGNFIGRDEPGAERGESVAALALVPGTAALQLKGALRHVVVQHVAGHVVQRLGFADIRRAPANHHGQLHFPVGFFRTARNNNLVVGASQGAGCFQKKHRLGRVAQAHFGGVVGVVQTHAHDFGWPGHGRAQALIGRHQRQRAGLRPHKSGQPGRAVGGKKRFVVVFAERGRAVALPVEQHTRFFVARRAVAQEFHRIKN